MHMSKCLFKQFHLYQKVHIRTFIKEEKGGKNCALKIFMHHIHAWCLAETLNKWHFQSARNGSKKCRAKVKFFTLIYGAKKLLYNVPCFCHNLSHMVKPFQKVVINLFGFRIKFFQPAWLGKNVSIDDNIFLSKGKQIGAIKIRTFSCGVGRLQCRDRRDILVSYQNYWYQDLSPEPYWAAVSAS